MRSYLLYLRSYLLKSQNVGLVVLLITALVLADSGFGKIVGKIMNVECKCGRLHLDCLM